MKTVKSTQIIKRIRVELTAEDIVLGNIIALPIPEGVTYKVYVSIPGGGDWSCMNLDIDKNTPVIVEWEEIHEN